MYIHKYKAGSSNGGGIIHPLVIGITAGHVNYGDFQMSIKRGSYDFFIKKEVPTRESKQ